MNLEPVLYDHSKVCVMCQNTEYEEITLIWGLLETVDLRGQCSVTRDTTRFELLIT